jgi:6-phosphogluconolactonase
MGMKFKKTSQLLLAIGASTAAALLVSACSQITQTLTVDFVYVASALAAGPNQYGEIDVFEINSESGRMRQIPSSPFPSGGRNPVAEVASSDYGSLFVANHDDNTVVQFVIGSDGKLYPFSTVNTPGTFPLAMAANQDNLFVVDTFQPLPTCSPAQPCSGSLAVYPLIPPTKTEPVLMQEHFPINACNGLDYLPLTLSGAAAADIVQPTGTAILPNGADLLVTAWDSTANTGYVFAYSIGTLTCGTDNIPTLTPLAGSPYPAGTHPSAVAGDSSSSYVYVTDLAGADVLGYAVTSGGLTPLTSGMGGSNRFTAGNQPSAIVVDPTYPYVYVTNMLDSTVSAYTTSNGALNPLGNYATGTQPVAIGIDPSTNRFLFSANFLAHNVSGWQLNTADGTLLVSQLSPFGANAQPTAVAAIPHNGTGAGIQKP